MWQLGHRGSLCSWLRKEEISKARLADGSFERERNAGYILGPVKRQDRVLSELV